MEACLFVMLLALIIWAWLPVEHLHSSVDALCSYAECGLINIFHSSTRNLWSYTYCTSCLVREVMFPFVLFTYRGKKKIV